MKNGEVGGEVEVYRVCVHLFGEVWSPSCAGVCPEARGR